VFAVNRAATSLDLEVALRGFGRLVVDAQTVLTDPDLAAANTAQDPERLVPRPAGGATVHDGRLSVRLPARSWNVVRLAEPV
jgi:alpha-N-arabinofuranosidase